MNKKEKENVQEAPAEIQHLLDADDLFSINSDFFKQAS